MRLIKNSFATGEISPYAMGRTDFQGQSGNKYDHACESMQNFIPLIQGGATKRPGSRFICQAPANSVRLIPFVNQPVGQSYVVEFTAGLCRFYKSGGIILSASTTVTTAPSGTTINVASTAGFTSSGTIIIGGVLITYAGVTGTQFTGCANLTGASLTYPTGTTVGQAYSITNPFASGDLPNLKYAQVGDLMYITSGTNPVQRLARAGDTNWSLAAPNFSAPPTHDFEVDYSGGASLSLSVATAGSTGTATTTGNVFLAGDVGRYLVVGAGKAYITAVGSPTSASVTIVDTFTAGPYASGTWFFSGSPSSYICMGAFGLSGPGQFSATTVFGPSVQALYAFASYPTNNAVPTAQATFHPQDLGRYIIVGGAVLQITSIPNPSGCTVNVVNSVIQTTMAFTNPSTGNTAIIMQAQGSGTWTLEDPSFTAANGYPNAVCFFQDRLFFANTTAQSQNIWASQTSDYENFAKGAQDSDSLDFEVNSGYRENILWLSAYQGQIAAGTPESEYIISGGGVSVGGNGAAITPANLSAAVQSRYGVSFIQPLIVEARLLYIQKAAQTAYEFAYDIYTGIFNSKNLNILHDIITTSGFTEMAYAAVPYRIISLLDAGGNLLFLTYNREQDIWAWSRHFTGQDLDPPDKFVSQAVILSPGALSSELWYAVTRNINNVSVTYIERMGPNAGGVAGETPYIVAGDSATVTSASGGPPVTVISQLQYLYGRLVYVNQDGAVGGLYQVPASGTITLQTPATNVQVALPSCSQILTVRPEIQGAPSIQGVLKMWSRVQLRLYNTIGGEVNGDRIPFRKPSNPMTQAVPLSYGGTGGSPDPSQAEGHIPGGTVYNVPRFNPNPVSLMATFDMTVQNLGWDRDGRVLICQHQPLPMTVIAMFGTLTVGQQ